MIKPDRNRYPWASDERCIHGSTGIHGCPECDYLEALEKRVAELEAIINHAIDRRLNEIIRRRTDDST